MPIRIVGHSNILDVTDQGTAFMIAQRNSVRTIKGRRVGTPGLMNCLGLVIHSPRDCIGCLAHVEAQDTSEKYIADVFAFIGYMTSKIAKYGAARQPADTGLQAALFGNSGMSTTDQDFADEVRARLIHHHVAAAQVIDLRNTPSRGRVRLSVGTAALPADWVEGNYACITYSPGTKADAARHIVGVAGHIDAYHAGHAGPTAVAKGLFSGLRVKPLQPIEAEA